MDRTNKTKKEVLTDTLELPGVERADVKRNSIMAPTSHRTTSHRTSISVTSGGTKRHSIFSLMASKRFAKRLMSRALEKRESTVVDVPIVNYENTYQTGPKAKFNTHPVREIIKHILDTRLEDEK